MLYEKNFQNSPSLAQRRTSLRRNATKAEQVLWQELRAKKYTYRFRHQFSIGPYIVDFYCHRLKLIIELDGPIHAEQKEYDEQRQEWLKKRGYVIIRYLNDQVLFDREILLRDLMSVCRVLEETEAGDVTSP